MLWYKRAVQNFGDHKPWRNIDKITSLRVFTLNNKSFYILRWSTYFFINLVILHSLAVYDVRGVAF